MDFVVVKARLDALREDALRKDAKEDPSGSDQPVLQGRQNHITMVFWFFGCCGLTMVFAKARLRVAKNHVFYGGGKNHVLLPAADTCLTLHLCSLSV